ncbi:MAG: glycosyltransferase [Nocardioides sp.]
MRSRHRSDLVSGELRRVPAQPGCYALHLRDGTGAWVTGDLGGLLSAADVFVAADTCLTACNPALAAVDAGLPIVAATTDSAQDLVLAGAAVGRLAKPRPDAVAGAVAALVDEGALLRRRIQRAPDARRRTADLAHQLLQVYHQVSPQPVTGGAR